MLLSIRQWCGIPNCPNQPSPISAGPIPTCHGPVIGGGEPLVRLRRVGPFLPVRDRQLLGELQPVSRFVP
jgi:hypothetical protein